MNLAGNWLVGSSQSKSSIAESTKPAWPADEDSPISWVQMLREPMTGLVDGELRGDVPAFMACARNKTLARFAWSLQTFSLSTVSSERSRTCLWPPQLICPLATAEFARAKSPPIFGGDRIPGDGIAPGDLGDDLGEARGERVHMCGEWARFK
jgi:hypothetical protein